MRPIVLDADKNNNFPFSKTPIMNHIVSRFSFAPLLVGIVLAVTACHKKTASDFRLERYTYTPGETLDIINLSPKKRRQIWEILNPAGESDTVVEGQAPQLTLDILGKDGMYTVRLFDNKKEKSKNVASEKTIMVTAQRGNVIIYSNPFANKPFPVFIDNQSVPGKHQVKYQLPVGKHVIKASCIYFSGGPAHTLDTVVTVSTQNTTYLELD